MTERPLPLTFPLKGARLIEASAGTGKTFTLAALYVRLVLQHGEENAFRRKLIPPEILVVTFTEAATRELRDRIRNRLAETARVFRGQQRAPDDPVITGLLADYGEDELPLCADLLEAAAQWMDEAAVYTIHSFCQRMLRQHAFDSGSLFNLELSEDEDRILENAVQDYWRIFCYPLTVEQAKGFAAIAETPDQLRKQVRSLLGENAKMDANTEASAAELLDQVLSERKQKLNESKDFWRDQIGDLIECFNKAWKEERLSKKKPSTSKKILEWLNNIAAWSEDPDATKCPITDTAFARLSREELAEHGENIDEILDHPAIARLTELESPEQNLTQVLPRVLPHAAAWITERIQQYKRQHAVMGFDDMLSRLRDALRGDNGDKLARIIREQFPVALIDEFQDTDPIQYQIFHSIYADQPDIGWFMIGDPKQAIYAFRGADIFTYLRAKDAVGRNLHTLGRNFRSRPALVHSINRVFDAAEARGDEGAFQLDHRIPFEAVEPKEDKGEGFYLDGQAHPALTFWLLQQAEDSDQSSIGKTDYRDRMAESCAAEMTRLLNQGRDGAARLKDGEKEDALKPADMAVLVRTGGEAQLIREALAEHGVRSVYLSDKDNVLTSAEANDVLLWLVACAEPESESALRAALATATLDYSWAQLDELGNNERQWEEKVGEFREYHRRWRRQGVLAMLRTLMREHNVPARLLQQPDGERSLTNLLHLSELLQQASAKLDGEQALVRWLAEEQDAARDSAASEEQIMRLESDADLVKVITIHKSKGLEYPLVFLPFVCHYRPVGKEDLPLRYHDKDDELCLSLEPDEAILEQAERERLAEDTRLLYVAMTRAKHACWLGMAPLRSGRGKHRMDLHHSAVGQVLGMTADHGASDLEKALRALAGSEPGIALEPAPEPTGEVLKHGEGEPKLERIETFKGIPLERWWVASYSALQHEAGRQTPPDSPRDEDYLEEAPATEAPLRKPPEQRSVHDFVRGPMAGTFLHGLLEVLADEGFDAPLDDNSAFAEALHQRLTVRRWEDWYPLLQQWMTELIRTPLPLHGTEAALSDLRPNQYRPELEFLFPAHRVSAGELDRVIRRHVLPGRDRPSLRDEQLNGMLKGFIDLVFEYDSRYYVMDYKSNHLGTDNSAYTEAAMRETVLEKRYDVQYSLYLLALHRLLQSRLGDAYDYDTHIGGCAYYFLRGIGADSRGLYFERPPKELMEELDLLFRGDANHAA